MWKRRRGTAIVETDYGILVTSGRRKIFLLPGGGTNRGESRRRAAIRELEEETGLKAIDCKYLFSYEGGVNRAHGGGHFQDYHKVFLIKATGHARPQHEIKHIEWYRPGMQITLSRTTREILEKYYFYRDNKYSDTNDGQYCKDTEEEEDTEENYSQREHSCQQFFEDDCYKILGLKSTVSNSEINKRYKQLATMYHPDRAINEEMKEIHNQKMSELNEAYQKIKKIRGI